MSDELTYHLNKVSGKTYMSRRIIVQDAKKLRHASKVFDLDEGFMYAKEKDEIVIRITEGGRKEIIAKFFEDSRGISVVTIQSFNPSKGTPHKTYFSFVGSEIGQIIEFFHNISNYQFENAGNANIADEELRKIILSQKQAKSLLKENQNLFVEAFRTEVTNEDVVALGYRKKQLEAFSKLLDEPDYFTLAMKQKNCRGKEDLWQKYFDKNKWIFGYGLNYIFVTGFENKKLEQIVQGNDLLTKGKRADALMMTKGIISSLCFVEIKTHETLLLDNSSYRPGCWPPSRELVGAVSQVQGTIASASKNLYDQIMPVTKDGDPTGEEVFNYKPKAFIVIGNLQEFVAEYGVNKEKLRSFELYRSSLKDVEIITFDELYERTRFIVHADNS
ncbi:MAG: hypothetical protein ACJAWW_000418 [Sulfurimonas sp.]|jgi:hypothetical protein